MSCAISQCNYLGGKMSFAHADAVNAGARRRTSRRVARRRSAGKSSYLDVTAEDQNDVPGVFKRGCNIRPTFENNSEVVNHESLAGAVKFLRNWSTAHSPAAVTRKWP